MIATTWFNGNDKTIVEVKQAEPETVIHPGDLALFVEVTDGFMIRNSFGFTLEEAQRLHAILGSAIQDTMMEQDRIRGINGNQSET